MRRKHSTLLLTVLAAVGLGLVWWSGRATDKPSDARGPGALADAPGQMRAKAEASTAAAAVTRGPAAVRQPVAETPTFASYDEEGNPIVAPARDGLVLWLCSPRAEPCADVAITAHWRKGFGLYGKDLGRTDAAGRFATTVGEAQQFESVEVDHPRLGSLRYGDDMLPTATDPRTVCLVVPDLASLRVRVVDGGGGAVANAAVRAVGGGANLVARQHVLHAREQGAQTDSEGHSELSVPPGTYELTAVAERCTLPQSVWADVGADGGEATVVLLRDEHRVEVDVRVTLPAGTQATPSAVAFTREAPPRSAAMPGRAGEAIYREFLVDRQAATHFVVHAEPVSWRLVARAEGCQAGVVDVPALQRQVAVALESLPPPPARAVLVVTVLDPDGKPTFADLRVHETTDLVHGIDRTTLRQGRPVIEMAPGARVCVSARRSGFALTLVGPFDLKAGEQTVVVRLDPALVVAGRVVDARGNGVRAWVRLHRPAGALRGLAAHVPEILDSAPTDGERGTPEDGRFHFDDCGAGEHEIWAFPEAGGWPGRKRVQPGVETTIVLGQGLEGLTMVEGTVRDATTGILLADVKLRCGSAISDRDLRTDAGGHFQFVSRPGDLQIMARRRDYIVHTTPSREVEEGPVQVDILLPPSPVFFVRVLDAAGRPMADAEVSVLDEHGQPIDLVDAEGNPGDSDERTNQAGRADLRGVPIGPVRLSVTHDGQSREFDVPATAGRDAVFDVRWPQ